MKKTNLLLLASTLTLVGSSINYYDKPKTTKNVEQLKRKESNKEEIIKPRFVVQKGNNVQEKAITSISMKPGFYSINNSIYYFDELGMPHTGFIEFEGNTYYLLDKVGLAKEWQTINDATYYFDNEGKMKTGITTIDDKEFYFGQDGKLMLGFVQLNNKVFYYNENGKQIGFLNLDNQTYYIDSNNGLLTSFQTIGDYDYYFDMNGTMQFGFQTINETLYYFDNEGHKKTGWIRHEEQDYYLNENELLTGLQKIDDNFYYFNENGIKQVGLQEIDDNLYFFNEDGKMETGFKEIEKQLYYFNNDGQSITGFIKDNNNTYYLSEYQLKTGLQIIDNKSYYFNESGILQHGFQKIDNDTYYFNNDGTMLTGELILDNKSYYFNELGKLESTNFLNNNIYNENDNLIAVDAKKIIDVSKFQGDINWEQVKNSDVDGVILRLGFGSYSIDEKFIQNLNELKRLEIPYGIYLYSYAVDKAGANAEANFVLDSLKNYDIKPTLGIYYDIESNNITSHLTTQDYEAIIPTFLDLVRTSSFKTNVYTYKALANEKLYSDILKKEITWIAQYNDVCTWDGYYEGWQYTSKGEVPGIIGNVDISIFGNFKKNN